MVDVHAGSFERRAREVAKRSNAEGPGKPANNIEGQEMLVIHLGGTGDDWREGAHYWYETGDNDSLAAMVLVKFLGFLDVVLFKKPCVGPVENMRACLTAKPVAGSVAKDSSERKQYQEKQERYWHVAGQDTCMIKHTNGKQQAVAWQEKADKQTRLGENYQQYRENTKTDNYIDKV